MKHKHYDAIIAWANGDKIQLNTKIGWQDNPYPSFYEGLEYRIKPEPKPDIIYEDHRQFRGGAMFSSLFPAQCHQKVRWIIDGETGRIKSVELVTS